MLEADTVERVAGALRTDPALIEKDWHVVRAIGVIATLDATQVRPVFSGGTSLAKGWGILKRFSEDIDFKVAMPGGGKRAARSRYRDHVFDALAKAGFKLVGTPLKGNASSYFAGDFAYDARFPAAIGLRPHVRVEMSYMEPALPPVERPVQSLISLAERSAPEVRAFPCIDPVETAADKLSALAWRVVTRDRGNADDDPRIARHLHDLAALETRIAGSAQFPALVRRAADDDAGRGGGTAPVDAGDRFAAMLEQLDSDPLWAEEYGSFVGAVSFAAPEDEISFADALTACRRLVAIGTRV